MWVGEGTAQGQPGRFLTSQGDLPINLVHIKTQPLIGLGPGEGQGTTGDSRARPASPTAPCMPRAPPLLTRTTAGVLRPEPTWFLLRVSMVPGPWSSWGHSRKQVRWGGRGREGEA